MSPSLHPTLNAGGSISPQPSLSTLRSTTPHKGSDQTLAGINPDPPLLPSPVPQLPIGAQPFSIIDFSTKIWICSFCLHRNHFPHHYADLFSSYTMVEYEPQNKKIPSQTIPQVFFFVLDTCMIEGEIGFLRSGLSRVIGEIPGDSLIGLITFGICVCVHELGVLGRVPKVYVFNGAKEITKDQVLEQTKFFLKKPRPATGFVAGVRDGLSQESINRFLLPAADCEFMLNSVLDELQKDPWPVPADQRAPRSTSTALTVTVHLFGVCVPGSGARIMAFLGFEQLFSALLFYSRKISKWL